MAERCRRRWVSTQFLFFARAAIGLLAVARGEWILGREEESCTKACRREGMYCSEKHWPEGPNDLRAIAKSLNQNCNAMQRGNVVYDPSIDFDFCGWKGDAACRCDADATWPARRFCWCGETEEPASKPNDCAPTAVAGEEEEWGESW
jgi:hypothetical protein